MSSKGSNRKRSIASLVALLVCSTLSGLLPVGAQAGWNQPIGGPLSTAGSADTEAPSIAEIGGTPFVAWAQASGSSSRALVYKLDNGIWRQVGGEISRSPSREAIRPTIANIAGVPYVAWEEYTSGSSLRHVYVDKLEAGTWQAVGGEVHPSTTVRSIRPRIAGISGTPYVAWQKQTTSPSKKHVAVSAFNGTSWHQVGDDLELDPDDHSFWVSVTDVGGVPYATWEESETEVDPDSPSARRRKSTRVYVARFDGAAWRRVGGELRSPIGVDAFQSRIVDVGGTPYVAWEECDQVSRTQDDACTGTGGRWHTWAARLDGASWQIVGGELRVQPTGNNLGPSLTVIGGAPYIAWEQYGGGNWYIWVARLDGASWQVLGGQLNASKDLHSIRPSIVGIGGIPFATWVQFDGDQRRVMASRLEPDFLSAGAQPSFTGATLTVQVKTYGLSYPVGFQWGAGSTLSAPTARSAVNGDNTTVAIDLDGLTPASAYSFRPIATAGTDQPPVLGATQTFNTPTPANKLVIASRATKLDRRGDIPLQLQCQGSFGGCNGTLNLSARLRMRAKKRKHARKRVRVKSKSKSKSFGLGSNAYGISAGQSTTVKISLSPALRKLVLANRRVRALATAFSAATQTSTSSGATQAIEVKAPYKRKRRRGRRPPTPHRRWNPGLSVSGTKRKLLTVRPGHLGQVQRLV